LRTRQIAEATNTLAAKTHQLGGRHRYFPVTIPTEKNNAAQKSGWRAEICFLLRESSLTGIAWRALNVLGEAAMFGDANAKQQFYRER
jgi:hypothetical protein